MVRKRNKAVENDIIVERTWSLLEWRMKWWVGRPGQVGKSFRTKREALRYAKALKRK